eukprot:CAMPEP_0202910272 /NCGR_PEP_ID=MMETSP1392-20130828/51605_1 /ASSEMBLY_ACC=CAM_ASM_000868 /TAXON_ID=225041 /ORGANISM="Chlamydomonas chlamydogama, Strain SAG 11-48b" /LENGTH=482 /DNA_ID=CAMNT_0049600335 /DNA_START=92 /DNA_END=1536 /DNA_ORIENTATION=+
MSTRTSFRPRPVDINKQLVIVRDVSELDNSDGVANLEGHDPQALQSDLGAAQQQEQHAIQGSIAPAGPTGTHSHQKKPKPKEIPVPEVKEVPTYTRDYLPLYRLPETYIRGKGGSGWQKDEYVEYDLDNEDEEWLQQFNGRPCSSSGQLAPLLSDVKFEKMMWKLEVCCAEATDRALTMSGASMAEKMTVAAAGTTAHFPKEEALSVLRKAVGGREQLLEAVYDYWLNKRKRSGKPFMRRLQAPTPATDTNPYNVFRPREKASRPQTRRRRENSAECLEKMRLMRENMLRGLEVTELVLFRERRKRDIHRVDVEMQRFQIILHHQPRNLSEQQEREASARLQDMIARSSQGEARLRAYLETVNGIPAPAIEQAAAQEPAEEEAEEGGAGDADSRKGAWGSYCEAAFPPGAARRPGAAVCDAAKPRTPPPRGGRPGRLKPRAAAVPAAAALLAHCSRRAAYAEPGGRADGRGAGLGAGWGRQR